MFKKILVGVVSASFLLSSVPSEAAFGRSTSSSSSRSYSSPSRSSASVSPSTSSRNSTISQGSSIGMTRSNVTNSVRDGSYKQTAPVNNSTVAGSGRGVTPSYNNNYGGNNGYYNNRGYSNNGYNGGYSNGGHSTGALIAAAGAGALAGYLLHRDSSGNTYYTNPSNPGVAYNGNGQALGSVPQGDYQVQGQVPQQTVVTQNSHPFIWFLVGLVLLLVIIGLVALLKKKLTE